jgi:hypothetical protein
VSLAPVVALNLTSKLHTSRPEYTRGTNKHHSTELKSQAKKKKKRGEEEEEE